MMRSLKLRLMFLASLGLIVSAICEAIEASGKGLAALMGRVFCYDKLVVILVDALSHVQSIFTKLLYTRKRAAQV